MPSQRKFYRTLVTVEVLSEDEAYIVEELQDVVYDITTGHYSGKMTVGTSEEVDGPAMAQLLKAQGSDPEFFQLDEDGNDIEGSEDEEEEDDGLGQTQQVSDGGAS